MVQFGAPVSYGDDTWRAVEAALDLQAEAIGLEPPGLPPVDIS